MLLHKTPSSYSFSKVSSSSKKRRLPGVYPESEPTVTAGERRGADSIHDEVQSTVTGI